MYKFDENEAPVIDLGNGHVVRLEPEELNKKDRDKAEKELRENEEIRTAAIKEFIILMSGEVLLLFYILGLRSIVLVLHSLRLIIGGVFDRNSEGG